MKREWGVYRRYSHNRRGAGRGWKGQKTARRKMTGRRCCAVCMAALFVLAAAGVFFGSHQGRGQDGLNGLDGEGWLTGEDFGVERVVSPVDFNGNGLDDYMDILLGARADALAKPRYKSAYYDGGYPPDDEGVCTDVIWRAFREAGYCLRDMVDRDIAARPQAYPWIETRDKNIDFRRVANLRVFFETYGQVLPTDVTEIEVWQPGDIVVFGPDDQHIGIISDRRTGEGRTLVIHNVGQAEREEDYLRWEGKQVTGHYRFDASGIDEAVLAAWG